MSALLPFIFSMTMMSGCGHSARSVPAALATPPVEPRGAAVTEPVKPREQRTVATRPREQVIPPPPPPRKVKAPAQPKQPRPTSQPVPAQADPFNCRCRQLPAERQKNERDRRSGWVPERLPSHFYSGSFHR